MFKTERKSKLLLFCVECLFLNYKKKPCELHNTSGKRQKQTSNICFQIGKHKVDFCWSDYSRLFEPVLVLQTSTRVNQTLVFPKQGRLDNKY